MVELVVVVAILSIIAAFVTYRLGSLNERTKVIAAEKDLKTIVEAFMDPESGYLHDHRGLPKFSLGCLRMANLLISTNNYGVAVDGSDIRVESYQWSDESGKGWRGPYLKHWNGNFPLVDLKRGFWPNLSLLRLPADFRNGYHGCSIYGFPGEPAVIDPWGSPYVLQIPPPQAFRDESGSNRSITPRQRFEYARVVSAGANGRLETPCFHANGTNDIFETTWSERQRRLARQAGRIDGSDIAARGDDLVYFLMRNDIDEGEGWK